MSNAADAQGNFVVVGRMSGGTSLQLSPTVILTSTSANTLVVAKFGSDGTPLWVKGFGSTGSVCSTAWAGYCDIAVDRDGNIAVTTSYEGALTVGSTTLPDSGARKAAVFKLTPAGDPIWARAATVTGGTVKPTGVSTGPDGSVVISGSFSGTIDFGAETAVSPSSESVFVAKYESANGAFMWYVFVIHQLPTVVLWVLMHACARLTPWFRSDTFGGSDNFGAYRIKVDQATGDIVVTGSYRTSATVGSNNLPITSTNATAEARGDSSAFVVKYNAQGKGGGAPI